MATKPKSEAQPAPSDARGKIVDALMELAGERRFEDISIRDICETAGVSLADFRELLPLEGGCACRLFSPHRPRRPGPG